MDFFIYGLSDKWSESHLVVQSAQQSIATSPKPKLKICLQTAFSEFPLFFQTPGKDLMDQRTAGQRRRRWTTRARRRWRRTASRVRSGRPARLRRTTIRTIPTIPTAAEQQPSLYRLISVGFFAEGHVHLGEIQIELEFSHIWKGKNAEINPGPGESQALGSPWICPWQRNKLMSKPNFGFRAGGIASGKHVRVVPWTKLHWERYALCSPNRTWKWEYTLGNRIEIYVHERLVQSSPPFVVFCTHNTRILELRIRTVTTLVAKHPLIVEIEVRKFSHSNRTNSLTQHHWQTEISGRMSDHNDFATQLLDFTVKKDMQSNVPETADWGVRQIKTSARCFWQFWRSGIERVLVLGLYLLHITSWPQRDARLVDQVAPHMLFCELWMMLSRPSGGRVPHLYSGGHRLRFHRRKNGAFVIIVWEKGNRGHSVSDE